MFAPAILHAADPVTKPVDPKQQFSQSETDPKSPRKSLIPDSASSNEIFRVDVDNDGDPDLLEAWWNGKRARWIDENDDMKPADLRGDMVGDAVQIDRDGDGYYDGPSDISIKWADDDGDGIADLHLFGANPAADQRAINSGTSHWMVYIDVDKDGVNGYVDWTNFEFNKANWRVPPTTSPTHTIPPPNFSPDYMGDSIFLKEHKPPGVLTNPELNWENPFAFYDTDDDGVTEMSVRLLESAKRTGGTDDNPQYSYEGFANEAMGGWDLDNDSTKGNEFDFDISWRFFSPGDAAKEKLIDYRKFRDPHPGMKAPEWVIDGKYFRYDNWRKIDHFVYVTHDECFDAMWDTDFASVWLTFDEDDDDHRWERVELQYPTTTPYSTKRFSRNRSRDGAALGGHPQADSLGDRGEWDEDNSGKGVVYIGGWDGKIHLFGAENGAWTVDEHAKYWGSTPVLGNSSPDSAPKIGELVQYRDTDNNGFFDEITYDYDGDETVDLKISLLDFKTDKNPLPDVRDKIDPGQEQWDGMHNVFKKISADAFQDGLKIYRAAWKKNLTTPEIDDYAIATSTGDRYNQAYWLKEKLFRAVDARVTGEQQAALRKAHFTGDIDGVIAVIDALGVNAKK